MGCATCLVYIISLHPRHSPRKQILSLSWHERKLRPRGGTVSCSSFLSKRRGRMQTQNLVLPSGSKALSPESLEMLSPGLSCRVINSLAQEHTEKPKVNSHWLGSEMAPSAFQNLSHSHFLGYRQHPWAFPFLRGQTICFLLCRCPGPVQTGRKCCLEVLALSSGIALTSDPEGTTATPHLPPGVIPFC